MKKIIEIKLLDFGIICESTVLVTLSNGERHLIYANISYGAIEVLADYENGMFDFVMDCPERAADDEEVQEFFEFIDENDLVLVDVLVLH